MFLKQIIFHGGVFSDRLPNGRAGATLEISPEGLKAQTPDGQVFNIALLDLVLEMGGASQKMVFCRPHDKSITIFCEHPLFLQALTEGGVETSTLTQQLKRQRFHSRLVWALSLTIILGLGASVPWCFKQGVSKAVAVIPISVDEKIGDTAFKNMDLGGVKVTNPVTDEALKIIQTRLTEHFPKAFHIRLHLVQNSAVNAFALPGGNIVVYTGLLKNAQTPEEVAGVLAHEMAHVQHRHGLQRIMQSLGIVTVAQVLLGDVVGVFAAGKELLTLGTINAYSRKHETEADSTAVDILYRAEISPQALIDFFVQMQKENKLAPPVWLSTHPDFAARTNAVKKRLKPGPTEPLHIDWPKVQKQLE